MPKGKLTRPRADKGTRRNDRPVDKFYSFRLTPNEDNKDDPEQKVIDAIADYLDDNPSKSLRHFIVENFAGVKKEQQLAETLEQQIERLSSSIDRLLTLRLEAPAAPPPAQGKPDVDMDYLKRIQQTLRGGKK
jgi:hypothetical protein